MGNGISRKCCTDLFVTQRRKQRSASRSLQANCQHLGSSRISLSIISGLPLSMDDLTEPPFKLDGTTSTPCISAASSFVTASSYCGDTDEIFQFDPFSEAFKTEARVFEHVTTATSERRRKCVFDDMDPFPSTPFGEVPPSACSTFSEDPEAAPADNGRPATADEAADGTWTSFDTAAMTTVTVDSQDVAFVLTESGDALAADSVGDGVSTQRDENDSKEEMNGPEPEPAAAAAFHYDDPAAAATSHDEEPAASNSSHDINDDEFPDELSTEEQMSNEYYVKTTSDNRSRDTDSLTNFFECPDVSSHIAEKHEEQIADDGSTSRPLKTEEEDAAASFTITTETDDRQIVREESDTRAENTEERKVSEERDLCHEDDGKLLESQEVEENETIELEEAERTGRNDSCHHLEEQSGTDVPSTDSVARETHTSDDLPTCGPTEIPGVHYENDQVSPAGRQLIEAVEPRLDEVRTTVETSDAETPLEVKTQDSESANPAVPALSTTSPDAVGKIGDDVQLVSTNGLDAVVVEERAADEELGLADQPDFEPRTVDKSPEKASSPEQPADIEEASVRLDQLKSVADAFAAVEPSGAETPLEVEQRVSEPLSIAVPTLITTSPDVLGNTGDDIHLVSNSVLEAVKIEEVAANGELSAAEPYGTEESHVHLDNVESVIDASVADAADDEDVGKMASREPAAQSVLSARDVFIEQQVAAAAMMENVCVQCGKRVYEMEKVIADQAVYHKTCFRCSHCNRVLSIANFACMEGHIYCKPHFMEIFMTKGDYGDRRPAASSDVDAVTMVPLETVRGVYEKLSREAVEAQLTRPLSGRPLSGRRNQQEHGNVEVDMNDADDLETGHEPDDDVSAGRKSVIEHTAAWVKNGQQNGRAMSAPTTPVHRPLPVTDRDVTDDELPHRGQTQALVAQWRELEERTRAELMARLKAGTSRSRSLSGQALQRGESPSPSQRGEQGRSGVDRQQQTTLEAGKRRDGEDGDEDSQLPPPLMTQYMLAKFRDIEAETHIIAGLQAKDTKSFKWEVKQVPPLVRGLTGAAYGDVPRSGGHDAESGDETAQQPTTTGTSTSAGEDELPEPGTTRNLLAKFQSLQETTQ